MRLGKPHPAGQNNVLVYLHNGGQTFGGVRGVIVHGPSDEELKRLRRQPHPFAYAQP